MHILARYRWLMPLTLAGLLHACHSDQSSTADHTSTEAAFTVGGAVTGSTGTVTLSCSGTAMMVPGNGPFVCIGTRGVGATYTVTVLTSPPAQTCEVTSGSGAVTNTNITSVMVTCAQTAFAVTVSTSGLFVDGSFSLTLGGVSQVVAENGDLPMTLAGTVGEHVNVTIASQPAGQLCVANLSAFYFSAVAAHVAIACVRDMQLTSGSAATMVLGQTDFVTATQPSVPVPVGQFNVPAGRVAGASNGVVYVCEYAGNQVSAVTPGADASRDFRLGIDVNQTASVRYTAQDLSGPTSVAVSDTFLAVASGSGSRVLLFNSLPAAAVGADVVVGQAGFGVPPVVTCSPNNFVTPTDVGFANDKLMVADSGCNRVVIFDPVPTAHGAGANMVLGQPDFTSYDPNRGFGSAGPGTLNHPSSVWANGNTLFVADAYNNRVMVWSSWPTTWGQPADLVLGQTSFSTVTGGAGANAMAYPYAVIADASSLFVADALNNRVLIYALPLPTVGTPVATKVLGQADLTSNTSRAPQGVASAQNLYQPTGLGFFNATLLVNDGLDYRVLGYASR